VQYIFTDYFTSTLYYCLTVQYVVVCLYHCVWWRICCLVYLECVNNCLCIGLLPISISQVLIHSIYGINIPVEIILFDCILQDYFLTIPTSKYIIYNHIQV